MRYLHREPDSVPQCTYLSPLVAHMRANADPVDCHGGVVTPVRIVHVANVEKNISKYLSRQMEDW